MSVDRAGAVPRRGISRFVVRIIVAAAIQVGAQTLAFGWSTGWRDLGGNVTHNTVVIAHDWVVVVAATASVATWVWALLRPRPGGRLLRSSICVAVAVGLFCTGRVVGDSWSVLATRVRGQTTYALVGHFGRGSVIRGPSLFLATGLDSGAVAAEAEIRSSLAWHWDSTVVRMVRPASMSGSGYVVQSTAAGWVLGMADEMCLAAYDPSTGAALSDTELARLSPFLLLRQADKCNAEDLARLVADLKSASAIGDRHGYVSPVPRDIDLVTAAESTNPAVRDAARMLIEAGGRAMYPESTRRLEELR